MSLVACDGVGEFGSDGDDEREVTLVQQPWEDLVVENQIASIILDELGYSTTIQELSVPIGAEALATGDADAYLGNWWPSQQDAFAEYLEDERVDVLSTLVSGVTYAPAVPRYVAEEYGVRSLADLAARADQFDGEFLGIEPGTPGNKYIADAISADAYGLGDWDLVESSTPAMLAEVERRVDQERAVVFLGWDPHWMNVEWDLVYLEDPDDVWPGAGEIRVVTREGFADDDPNVARLLSQMKVDRDTASEWIHELSREDSTPEAVAREWISDNHDEIREWLDGMETVDGDPAEVPDA